MPRREADKRDSVVDGGLAVVRHGRMLRCWSCSWPLEQPDATKAHVSSADVVAARSSQKDTVHLSRTLPPWRVLEAVDNGSAEYLAGFVAQAVGKIACGLSGEMASELPREVQGWCPHMHLGGESPAGRIQGAAMYFSERAE